MQAAVDDVNTAGGVLGKKVALSFEDTQNQPAVAAAAARKLVEDKRVVGVVGEYHSGAALAQIPVYSEHGTPAVIVEAYNDKITAGDPADPKLPPRPPSVFRIAPTSSYANALNVDWLTQGVHATDVVQLYEATDYGTGQASTLKKGLEGKGVTLTQIKVDLNQPDYSAILQRVRQEHPAATVFVFDVTGESSYVIEQNAFGAGLLGPGKICVANQAAQDAKAFWRAVPDGAGCLFRLAGPPPARYTPDAVKLADRYAKQFNGAAKAWVFESYDAVRPLVDAIRSAGAADPGKVVAALERTGYTGVRGTYAFPYGAANPVPADKPAWLWHQWPEPPIQLVEYTAKNQSLAGAVVVWPPGQQSKGSAYVEPTR